MAKNIVICSDGTGNTSIKGRGTNVFKLFEAVDSNGHRTNPQLPPQIAIYDDGVGTQTWKPLALAGGAFGFGLGRNVRQLYRELVRIYDPGDRIFLFGFSRGAFTVRTLADIIGKCGILDMGKLPEQSALEARVKEAYQVYREGYQTVLKKKLSRGRESTAAAGFRAKHCLPEDTKIAFIGVWDTVDSVGGPSYMSNMVNAVAYPFKFPDHQLSRRVERACQALALDDERAAFAPELWDHDEEHPDRIDQVWFAGAHSNVGGGYPKQGMSLVALDWMLHKARASGLRLLEDDRLYCCDHANADDQLYNPRAGLGGMYLWRPRDVKQFCEDHGAPVKIHLSVLERIAHGTDNYAPGNVPGNAQVVITETGNKDQDNAAGMRALAVQEVLQTAHAEGGDLLKDVGGAIVVGRLAYALFGVGLLGLVIAAIAFGGPSLLGLVIPEWAVPYATAFGDALVKRFDVAAPRLILGSLTCLALAAFLIMWVNRWRTSVFSKFWYPNQPELRTALKAARKLSGGPPPSQNFNARQTGDQ